MAKVRPLGLDGVLEIVPKKFGDDRGFFSETYNARALAASGIDITFVQDNHSYSAAAGVLRGLHYQLPPYAQTKLVRVVKGRILDVAVDIRRGSPTFGTWVSLEISAEKWNQILVPAGFAHGFMTLEPDTQVVYKVDAYYDAASDRSINADDPAIGIPWPIALKDRVMSAKDTNAPLLADVEIFEFKGKA